MQIVIGSKNKAKISAVQSVFQKATVIPEYAHSHVSPQPFSDQETRIGAVNRALECSQKHPAAFCIGLEGGVMYVEDALYLCNWGALVTPEKKVYTASGARIVLPNEIKKQLEEGKELGFLMDAFAKKEGVRHKEGAIGIFTNNEITREIMFTHVVQLLKGQWLFSKEKGEE